MAAPHAAYEHVALVHDGPDDLARRLADPLRDALDRGEAVYACLSAPAWERLAGRIGPAAAAATVAPQSDRYANPGTAMALLHRAVDDAVTAGSPAVWSVGTLPFEGTDHDERWWRYEAAVDAVLGDRPLRAICTYDQATVPDLGAAHRTHAWIDTPDGRCRSVSFRPDSHREGGASTVDLPSHELVVEAVGPVRRAVTDRLGHRLARGRLDDLLLMVSEMVTNGLRHGRPPVVVRLWDRPDEVAVEVSDGGEGVPDVYADLRPRRGGDKGGFGLWLVGQLAHRMMIGRAAGRTVVRAVLRR